MSVGEQADDVEVIAGNEIAPACGEPLDGPRAQARDVAQLADRCGTDARHAFH